MTPEQDEMMNLLTALESTYVEYSEKEPFPNAANDAYCAMTLGVGNHAQELLTLVREQARALERVTRERDEAKDELRLVREQLLKQIIDDIHESGEIGHD